MAELAESDDDRNARFVGQFNGAHRRLYAYLVSLIGNRHDAEDVLQRASLTMWQQFKTFEAGTDFLAWASTVAFYEARNFQRVSSRSRLRFSEELLKTLAEERLPDLAQHDKRLDALNECLDTLNEPAQQLLQTVYAEEGNIADFARQLGRAPQTLYNKLAAIRRLLVDCVGRRLQGAGES